MAAHASVCLGHFPSGAGNPCLSVLLIASRAHRQHSSGHRTFKATLSHPNCGARPLLHLLLQKDTVCCSDICIQYGQKEKPEICLQTSQRLKRNHTSPSNHLEGCQVEISPPVQLLSCGCRGRVLYDILTYCPIKAKFSSN